MWKYKRGEMMIPTAEILLINDGYGSIDLSPLILLIIVVFTLYNVAGIMFFKNMNAKIETLKSIIKENKEKKGFH